MQPDAQMVEALMVTRDYVTQRKQNIEEIDQLRNNLNTITMGKAEELSSSNLTLMKSEDQQM